MGLRSKRISTFWLQSHNHRIDNHRIDAKNILSDFIIKNSNLKVLIQFSSVNYVNEDTDVIVLTVTQL